MGARTEVSLDPAVSKSIRLWQPLHLKEQWPHYCPFVTSIVRRSSPSAVSTAKRAMHITYLFAMWGVERHLPLDAEALFTPDLVEEFAETGLPNISDKNRQGLRSELRRIGPMVTKSAPWPPRPVSLSRSPLSLPYSPRDIEAFWSATQNLQSKQARDAVTAVLHLGLGAGLDGRWSVRVTGLMVRSIGGHAVIRVPAPGPRTIPIMADHADAVLRLAGRAGSSLLVPLGGMTVKRRMTWVSESMDGPGRPRLNGPRLRATWLHLLARRVPLRDFTVAAGPIGSRTPFCQHDLRHPR